MYIIYGIGGGEVWVAHFMFVKVYSQVGCRKHYAFEPPYLLKCLVAQLLEHSYHREQIRVMGSNPTQGSSFSFNKSVVLGVVELLAFAF